MSKQSLNDFFLFVERRAARRFPNEWHSFQIKICDRVIDLRFPDAEQAEMAARPLRGRICRTMEHPEAIFKYFVDDCSQYFSPFDNPYSDSEQENIRIRMRDDSGFLLYVPKQGFWGYNTEENIFYTIRHLTQEIDPLLYAHTLQRSFYQWGEMHRLLMIHGAVTGIDGKGVIISGYSGAGKSTLSVSCLLLGMNFISDDYTMISVDGELDAFPIYSSVCLTKEMYIALNPNLPILSEYREGKYALDASNYEFSSCLHLRGIIVPVIPHEDRIPEIVRIPTMQVVTEIGFSTTLQMWWGLSNPILLKTIISRLKGLPAYEFRQSRDFRKNAEYLRQFIKIKL